MNVKPGAISTVIAMSKYRDVSGSVLKKMEATNLDVP